MPASGVETPLSLAEAAAEREAELRGLPAMVAVYQPPRALDPSGTVEAALAARYELVATVEGVPVYALRR